MGFGTFLLTTAAAAQASITAATGPAAAAVLVLPAGSTIDLMVLREVDSDRAQPGDPVRLRVNSPVTIGETVVIPVGAAASGEVVAATGSGVLFRRGNLTVNITSITMGDEAIPLDTALEQEARGGKRDDFWKVFLAPHFALFARGPSARLKAGELLAARVEQDICFGPGETGYQPVACPADSAVGPGPGEV